MSLIEQAARRLEQLRQAGIMVPEIESAAPSYQPEPPRQRPAMHHIHIFA